MKLGESAVWLSTSDVTGTYRIGWKRSRRNLDPNFGPSFPYIRSPLRPVATAFPEYLSMFQGRSGALGDRVPSDRIHWPTLYWLPTIFTRPRVSDPVIVRTVSDAESAYKLWAGHLADCDAIDPQIGITIDSGEMDTQSLTGLAGAGDLKVSAVVKPQTDPLDAAYALSSEQTTFFKAQTGIDDDDDLRTHILEVQESAYGIFPYPCIKWFTFLQLGIATLPEYENIIKLGQECPDGILLDIGCCFGVDARKAVADGFPLKNIVTTDLKKEFYDMGHALFKTTPAAYPISFVAGDAFDPNMLRIVPPFDEAPSAEKPDLSTLTSLNPLAGRCTVIYASNFFHLFSEENQLQLAKALAGLLSPLPGSMICGEHVGNWQKGVFREELGGRILEMFQHSPESWSAMWEGEVFAKGKVRVDTKIVLVKVPPGMEYNRLQWAVVRL